MPHNPKQDSEAEIASPATEFPFSEPIDFEITDTIDLHAFRPDESRAVIRAYLAEAYSRRFRFVRIIHGKGIGVQREIVRKILGETEFVKEFKTGGEFSGDWGATVAELKINP